MKNKLFLSVVILISLISAITLCVSAETYGDLTYEIVNGTITITDCLQEKTGSITIPSRIDGYSVTRIGDNAFEDCPDLTSVLLPESITFRTKIDNQEGKVAKVKVFVVSGVNSLGVLAEAKEIVKA